MTVSTLAESLAAEFAAGAAIRAEALAAAHPPVYGSSVSLPTPHPACAHESPLHAAATRFNREMFSHDSCDGCVLAHVVSAMAHPEAPVLRKNEGEDERFVTHRESARLAAEALPDGPFKTTILNALR